MKMPRLSDRLSAVASLVTEGSRVCDVGCDHGFVSIYLVLKKISPHVIAMDVKTGPLSRAGQHIREYHTEQEIETRLSDGLAAYEAGEADSLILAGMGGPLMLRILEAFPEKTESFSELILQPQSETALFRKRLRELGYITADERMILEDGKYYPMMKMLPGQNGSAGGETSCDASAEVRHGQAGPADGGKTSNDASAEVRHGQAGPADGRETSNDAYAESESAQLTELQDAYGPLLLERKDPVLMQYLLWERRIIEDILAKKRDLEHWKRQRELNESALHMIQ